jgi:deoxycytidylate deaminase
MDLEDFVNLNDEMTSCEKFKIERTFLNTSIDDLRREVMDFKFDDKSLIRPDWDTYFMRIAEIVASRSNCIKRGVGALIVDAGKKIIS